MGSTHKKTKYQLRLMVQAVAAIRDMGLQAWLVANLGSIRRPNGEPYLPPALVPPGSYHRLLYQLQDLAIVQQVGRHQWTTSAGTLDEMYHRAGVADVEPEPVDEVAALRARVEDLEGKVFDLERRVYAE